MLRFCYGTGERVRRVSQALAPFRMLLVATTVLDKEQTVICNLGVIAAQVGSGAWSVARDIIVPSASIPGVIPPVNSTLLQGASVYLIVNGQFGAPTETTPYRTVAILKRSFTAASQSSSRTAIEIAPARAQRNGMQLRVAQIPNDYPYRGPLDAEAARMGALFRAYGSPEIQASPPVRSASSRRTATAYAAISCGSAATREIHASGTTVSLSQ